MWSPTLVAKSGPNLHVGSIFDWFGIWCRQSEMPYFPPKSMQYVSKHVYFGNEQNRGPYREIHCNLCSCMLGVKLPGLISQSMVKIHTRDPIFIFVIFNSCSWIWPQFVCRPIFTPIWDFEPAQENVIWPTKSTQFVPVSLCLLLSLDFYSFLTDVANISLNYFIKFWSVHGPWGLV